MKFAHIADVHIGSWRDPHMKELSIEAFIKSIDVSIKEKVDFVLIAGDLFNTAIPGIDHIKIAIKKIKELKEEGIPLYYIAGSHDYSPSGKTMLDVIEEAGLGTNVTKGDVTKDGKLKLLFTIDKKTGAKITGLLGRRGILERQYYENLDVTNLEKEEGFKIFMFHTSIEELKPKELSEMEANPISFLPKGFDYYAGGHVHIVAKRDMSEQGYKLVVYPGPTFPASFSELEKLGTGGFYIYEDGDVTRKELNIKEAISKHMKIENMSSDQATILIEKELEDEDVKDKIVLIRIEGKLSEGSSSKIDFKKIFSDLNKRGAYFIMKNSSKLSSKEFAEIKTGHSSTDEIESRTIKEHLGLTKHPFKDEENTTKDLIKTFSLEKNEGEKQSDYEERIKKETETILK